MGDDLLINDLFWTLQGEGANAGRRALFVRMPYCNLKCSWCDTSFNSFKKWSEVDFTNFALEEPSKFAVLTGGEPTMNKQLPRIITILKSLAFEIAIESNGTFPPSEIIDFVTISPKREAMYEIHPEAFLGADEFKYVVDKDFNFTILDRHDVNDGRRYSLSPEFGNFKESVEQIIMYIKRNPKWRLSLQTHKFIGIP